MDLPVSAFAVYECLSSVMCAAYHHGQEADDMPEYTLTPSEARVLSMVTEGCANKEIARALAISEETVKAHLKHIFIKLQVHSRTEAAVWWAAHDRS